MDSLNPDTTNESSISATKLFAELYLGDVGGITMRDTYRQDWLTFSQKSREVERLLRTGAEPNIILYGYRLNDTRFTAHRLMPAGPGSQFIEEPHVRKIIETQNSRLKDFMEIVWQNMQSIQHEPNLDAHLIDIKIPLIDAARYRDLEMVTRLTEFGANFTFVAEQIPTKYWTSLRNPFSPAVEALDSHDLEQLLKLATPKNSLISRWTGQCLTRIFEMVGTHQNEPFQIGATLLRTGVDVHSFRLPRQLPKSAVKFCIQNSIKYDKYGLTPLHIVAGDATAELTRYLVANDANVNAEDTFGMSPLLEAVYYGHLEVVISLLSHGADVNHRAGNQDTEFCDPCGEKESLGNPRHQVVRSFKVKQWPALHIAAHRGFSSIVNKLIEHGANTTFLDQSGQTALDIAIQGSNYDTAFVLLARGCPLRADSVGASGIMAVAADTCRYCSIRELVKNGVPLPADNYLQAKIGINQNWHDSISPEAPSFKVSRSLFHIKHNRASRSTFLCKKCSRGLHHVVYVLARPTKAKTSCNFCRLLYDCPRGSSQTIDVKYIKDTGSPDVTFSTTSNDFVRIHNVRRITNEWHSSLESLDLHGDDSTGSSAAIALSKHWLQTCVENHLKCSGHLSSQYFPTRILELQADIKQLRIVENAAIHAPYVALSHRWGTERLPQTTSVNLADRLRRLALQDLTQTMRDAVHITRKLGYCYIWIDALCIVQDSEADWLREASKMSEVFRGAIVTIAVADADNHSQGMFRPRLAQCIRPFPVPYLEHTPYRDRTHVDGEGQFYLFPNTGRVSAGARPKGTLDTRGWILQEQILSRRILYFGNGEIFWDCSAISASESSPISTSLLDDNDPDETWALKLMRRTLATYTSIEILQDKISDAWTQIIKNYSSRQLSKQSDKLIALEGIIRPLVALLREEHVAGMWRTQLWRQLIWWSTQPTSHGPPLPEARFPAPTWSWLSFSGPVAYHNSLLDNDSSIKHSAAHTRTMTSHNFTDLEPHVNIQSVVTETRPDASGITGSLTISGPAFRYRLTSNDLKKVGIKRFNASKWKLNPGKWLLDHSVELPLDVHCIVVAEDSVAKMLVCLCLIPDEEDGDKWKRIGLCHWDGLKWQVAKHAGMEPREMTFIVI